MIMVTPKPSIQFGEPDTSFVLSPSLSRNFPVPVEIRYECLRGTRNSLSEVPQETLRRFSISEKFFNVTDGTTSSYVEIELQTILEEMTTRPLELKLVKIQ